MGWSSSETSLPRREASRARHCCTCRRTMAPEDALKSSEASTSSTPWKLALRASLLLAASAMLFTTRNTWGEHQGGREGRAQAGGARAGLERRLRSPS